MCELGGQPSGRSASEQPRAFGQAALSQTSAWLGSQHGPVAILSGQFVVITIFCRGS